MNNNPTQPSEAHRKLAQYIQNGASTHSFGYPIAADDAAQLISDEVARATEKLRAENERLSSEVALCKEYNADRVGQLVCSEQRLATQIAYLTQDRDSLRQQLSASQEREKRLREALENANGLAGGALLNFSPKMNPNGVYLLKKSIAEMTAALSTTPTETDPEKET